MGTSNKSSSVEDNALTRVSESERQSWPSIALIWIGSIICVPALMLGGVLVSGLTVRSAIMSGLIGYSIVVFLMILQGNQGCDLGLPTVVSSSSAFGEKGSKIIISLVISIACMGWFGFQANVCGSAFSNLFSSSTGIIIPIWLSSLLWGIIMLVTAIYGFNALKYLNCIAVPSLIIVSVYGVYTAIQKYGVETIYTHQPVHQFSFVKGIALTVGSFAMAAVLSGDYSRYSKNRKDVIKSSMFGVIPVGVTMVVMGGIMSLVAGTHDISIVLADLGVPAFGMIALILATWTTNAVNAYSGGIAITNLLNLNDSKRSIATGVAGLVGTIIAVIGIMDYFVGFLSFLTSIIPPIAGVMIADYWIQNKGNPKTWKKKSGINSLSFIALIAGVMVSILIKVGIQPINGIVVSMLTYLLLKNVVNSNNTY